MNDHIKLIVAIGLVFSFIVNSIMFTWEATRRPADIRTAEQKRYDNCITWADIDKVQDCAKIQELAK